ncbi:hypothetical protein SAMN02745123_03608 [Desulforamulus aeronauticus DSM 10349]|uniref:Uncharacterized protein n=1 Tax=Desulforamulus aeronauticus DSM 10349 TaxID=1121421 RepID=A0A1M6WFP4_9FIRM|nr:hypothetical protein SAMN02745123_03608 [Desulforamulus aeronauticus DSM 10349]
MTLALKNSQDLIPLQPCEKRNLTYLLLLKEYLLLGLKMCPLSSETIYLTTFLTQLCVLSHML